jgi:hypothetical protein
VIRRLEPFDLFFLETPLPSDDLEGYAKACRGDRCPYCRRRVAHNPVRICGPDGPGPHRCSSTRHRPRRRVHRGNASAAHGAGSRKTGGAALAEDRDRRCRYRSLRSRHVQLPLYRISSAGRGGNGTAPELVQGELQIADGELDLPRRPGLGVELDPSAVRRFAKVRKTTRKLTGVSVFPNFPDRRLLLKLRGAWRIFF